MTMATVLQALLLLQYQVSQLVQACLEAWTVLCFIVETHFSASFLFFYQPKRSPPFMRNGGFWWLLLSWASFSSFCLSSSSSYEARAKNTPRKQTQVGWWAKNTPNRSIISLTYPNCPVSFRWRTWLKWIGLNISFIFPSLVGVAIVLWEKVIFHLRDAQRINSSVCLLHLVEVITIKMIADSFCCLGGRRSAGSSKVTLIISYFL